MESSKKPIFVGASLLANNFASKLAPTKDEYCARSRYIRTAQRTMLCLLSSVLCLLLAACGEAPLYQEQAYVFGTLVDITVYGENEAHARQGVKQVLQEFQRLHGMLHAWQPSELSALNAAIAKGEPKPVSPELSAMLKDAALLSEQSRHLFNPAIGDLVQAWGFQADEFKAVLPDPKRIAALVAANPEMSDISIESGIVQSRNKFVRLDLGGYAKGYALDRAAEILHKAGIRNALVNIGGNVLALGQHGNRPWRVGIQHPRKPGALATLDLHDSEAIGTSGDYQRYFMLDGVRYCHLIDPNSGYPASKVQAVAILTHGAHAGLWSDAPSKPLFIAGPGGWRAQAQRMDLDDAMLVDDKGNIHLTAGMQKRLEFTDKDVHYQVE
jgi:FAD:protein FMN transferase